MTNEQPKFKTDDAEPSIVLGEVLLCAKTWVPEARIIGNVRAGDIVRAIAALEAAQPVDRGWICYNAGPGTMFWDLNKSNLEHELTDDLRPATAFEEAIFKRFGKPTACGGFEFDLVSFALLSNAEPGS